jgi:hypothetical protein
MASVLESSRVALTRDRPAPRRAGPRLTAPALRPRARIAGLPRQLSRWFSGQIALTMQTQLQSEWCWAAVSTSVSHFFDGASSWTQCTVAGHELGQGTCCRDGSTAACNVPWYLDRALTRTGNLERRQSGRIGALRIRRELRAGRPVGARIQWAGGGGHFVVIAGARGVFSPSVEVRDPLFGISVLPLGAFSTRYQGNGSWTHTYFTRS